MNAFLLIVTLLVGLSAGFCFAWFWLERRYEGLAKENERRSSKPIDHTQPETRGSDTTNEETKKQQAQLTKQTQDENAKLRERLHSAESKVSAESQKTAELAAELDRLKAEFETKSTQTDEEPAPIAEVEAKPPTQVSNDDLKQIKGIGKVLEEKLRTLGITNLEQIANLNETDIAAIDEKLNFKGRIAREKWIEQAKDLVAG